MSDERALCERCKMGDGVVVFMELWVLCADCYHKATDRYVSDDERG